MGSTARNVVRELLLWGAVAGAAACLVYFYSDLRALLGPDMGSGSQSRVAVATDDLPEAADAGGEVRLRSDGRGHFVFEAQINGRPAMLMADTGATLVVLRYEDARKLGLSPQSLDFSGRASTANGVARVAPVTLDRVRIGSITVRDVPAAVAERGALQVNLLGMSFLGRLSSFEVSGGDLVLVR